MKTKVYSLFDLKAAVYSTPFFMPNDSMAVRSFSDLVNDKQTMVNRHPEDFILHGIGQFDDEKGVVEGMSPWVVVTASSLIQYEPLAPIVDREVNRLKKLVGNGIEEVVR